MPRLNKMDKRYSVLLTVPRVNEGKVVFRKKRGYMNKYVMTIFETDAEIHWVLYSFRDECMSFVDFPNLNYFTFFLRPSL